MHFKGLIFIALFSALNIYAEDIDLEQKKIELKQELEEITEDLSLIRGFDSSFFTDSDLEDPEINELLKSYRQAKSDLVITEDELIMRDGGLYSIVEIERSTILNLGMGYRTPNNLLHIEVFPLIQYTDFDNFLYATRVGFLVPYLKSTHIEYQYANAYEEKNLKIK